MNLPKDSPRPDAGFPLLFGPLWYRVDRREIGFLAALFECYEDLGAVRTVDPVAAIVEILYAPDFYADVVALMAALGADIPSLARMEPERA
ncbi:MAG: DUF4911 domain-containing protein [Nitrospirota bacterium]|nr:DUF4911 domain-containing protein [Nitrospirota bacterium]